MLKDKIDSLWTMMFAVLLMSITVTVAYADNDEDEERGMRASESHERGGERGEADRRHGNGTAMVVNAKWKEECGSCHMAYPPQFLSTESWRALMAGLDKHFGSNASLDPAVAGEIGNFLNQHASTKARPSVDGKEPALRISDTRWFKSEHREVSSSEWKNPKVKSPSNCGACHTKADTGSFSEHDVKMPR
ncbi:MAG: diheme cytochrome c [Gallionella sp.]